MYKFPPNVAAENMPAVPIQGSNARFLTAARPPDGLYEVVNSDGLAYRDGNYGIGLFVAPDVPPTAVGDAADTVDKPGGWVLEEMADGTTGDAMNLELEAFRQRNKAESKNRPFWEAVTDEDVRHAIRGTALEPLVEEFQAATSPALPLAAVLPKALAIAGCALSGSKGPNPNGPAGLTAAQAGGTGASNVPPPTRESGSKLARLRIMTGGARGQVANIYALVVAKSGSGKDIGNFLNSHLEREGWDLGTGGSAEGLADALILNPNGLLKISEFRNYLDRKCWESKAEPFLTSAYSEGEFKHNMSGRSNASSRAARYCYPSIYANIQPELYKEYCTDSSVNSGFLNRYLVAGWDTNLDQRPRVGKPEEFGALEAESIKALEQFKSLAGEVEVPENYMADLWAKFKKADPNRHPLWARYINEYGPRLAVMLSVKRDDASKPTVRLTQDAWDRAAILLQWFYMHAVRLLGDRSTDPRVNRLQMIMKPILEGIRKRGNAGMLKSEISRNYGRNSSKEERNAALDELLDREEIVEQPGVSTRGARYIAVNID